MHTTLDEQLAATDPRVTKHAARSAFLLAVHQAVEVGGLPAPMAFLFGNEYVKLRMDDDHPGDVDAWAAHLGLTYGTGKHVHTDNGGRPWRSHQAEHDWRGRWHGHNVDVWALAHLTDDEAAAYLAEQAVGS